MGQMYENPILDECRAKEDKAEDKPTQPCPICDMENSMMARRCIGRNDDGSRCEHYFSYVECKDRYAPNGVLLSKGCGTKNDPRSKSCRHCGEWLDDPSESLNGQHYHDHDYIDVLGFDFRLTKNQKMILVEYTLKKINPKTGKNIKAVQIFDISTKEKWKRKTWIDFVNAHCVNRFTQRALIACRSPLKALEYKSEVRAPLKVTHRINGNNKDLIARKKFEE